VLTVFRFGPVVFDAALENEPAAEFLTENPINY